jgi:hypothetical protein
MAKMNAPTRRIVKLKPCLVGVFVFVCFYLVWISSVIQAISLQSSDSPFVPPNGDDDGILRDNRHRIGPIFYNVYLPSEDLEKLQNALRIVEEQMRQRKWSDPSLQSPVWYTLIGSTTSSSSNLTDLCGPNCRQIGHVTEGDEVNTLQALWEYCQDHPEQLISYIHDKGSFHSTENNEKTRRTATKSALDCRTEMMKQPDLSQFNVCAGTMIVLPQYLCQANMWTAKCKYIRDLVRPTGYATAMQDFYDHVILSSEVQSTCLRPITMKDNHLGLGRYAYERWVWSHPNVIPADVIPMRKVNFSEFPPTWTPALGRSLKGSPKRMALDRGMGESSFARLEGRLLEWDFLYHRRPANDSWIWDYYRGYETGTQAFKIKYCTN